MGNGGSKVSAQIISEAVSKVSAQYTQKCAVQLTGSQILSIASDKNVTLRGVTITQNFTLNNGLCVAKDATNETLQRSIANSIQQVAQEQGIALLPAFQGAKAKTNIENTIKSEVNIKKLQECSSTASMQQVVNIVAKGNVNLDQVNMNQTIKSFQNCLSESLLKSGVLDKIIDVAKEDAKAKAKNPLDAVTNMIKAAGEALQGLLWGWGMYLIIGAVLLIAIIVAAIYFLKTTGASPQVMQAALTAATGKTTASMAQQSEAVTQES